MKKIGHWILLIFPIFIYIYALIRDDKHTEGQTYAYFILASILTLLIALLPRLTELTLNEKGLSVKMLDRISKKVEELETMTDATHRTKLTHNHDFEQELKEKVTVLRESIEAYKMISKKN